MDLAKYLTVLVVLCLEGGETGGGGKHHDHVRLHIPEFILHDHHKKVITIHHHHHKPKKEHHHHHHHHHHKPQIPYGHHYHRTHKKVHLKTHTESKGAGHHVGVHHGKHHKQTHLGHHGHKVYHSPKVHQSHQGHHGHQNHLGNHGHHGHQGHQGHHGYAHSYPYDAPEIPTYSYTPNAAPTFEDDFGSSFSPSVPIYGGGISNTAFSAPQLPHVHGVQHTVKQVKVFDSLPGALPNKGTHGYEVTEEGGEEEDDVFTSVNLLQHQFPATYGYVRGAAPHSNHDSFDGITSHGVAPTQFSPSHETGTSFTGFGQSDSFPSSGPTQSIGLSSVDTAHDFPVAFQSDGSDGFDNQLTSFAGSDGNEGSFLSNEENFSDETPVSFTREAGIQQTTKTGNVETIEY